MRHLATALASRGGVALRLRYHPGIIVTRPLSSAVPVIEGRRLWSANIREPLNRVSAHVEKAFNEIAALRPDVPLWGEAVASLASIAKAPSKRLIRPQLVLLGHAAGADGGDSHPDDGVELFAAGIELQHLFMLVHDDQMDRGTVRRGRQTLSVVLAEANRTLSPETIASLTVVLGDVLHAKSTGLLIAGAAKAQQHGLVGADATAAATNVVLDGAYRAGAAQFDDVLGWPGVERSLALCTPAGGGNSNEARQLLRRLLADKSAHRTFVSPLVAGVHLGGGGGGGGGGASASRNLIECCEHWGGRIGTAFQVLDDLGDLAADPLASGKDGLQDLREGRLSVPLFLLRERATQTEWAEVSALLSGHQQMDAPGRRFILDLVHHHALVDVGLGIVDAELQAAEAVLSDQLSPEEPFFLSPGSAVLGLGLGRFTDGLRDHAKQVRAGIAESGLLHGDAEEEPFGVFS